MRPWHQRAAWVGAVAACALASPSRAGAQVFSTSARAAGLAESYGAVARGATAGQLNPANLGLPGNATFSVYLPAGQLNYGTDPIPLSEFKDYEGQFISDSVKSAWLNQIGPNGTLTGTVSTDVAALGVSYKWFALTTAVQATSRASLPYDAVEVLLYGNAGQSGTGPPLSFTDGNARAYAVSDLALSFGFPIIRAKSPEDGTLALGVTGKYVLGQGLADAHDGSAVLSTNPVADTVRFPVVALYDSTSLIQASGFGMDLGAAWNSGALTVGLTVYDVFNTLKFNPTMGQASSGYAVVNENGSTADVDPVDIAAASPQIQQLAESLAIVARFKPTLRLAAAYQLSSRLLLAGDALWHTGSDQSLYAGAKEGAGAGAEFMIFRFWPVRGGMRYDNIGFTWSVGTGLRFGAFAFDVAYGMGPSATSWLGLGLGIGTS